MLMDFCHKTKNLYNHANYLMRYHFFNKHKVLSYLQLDKLLKNNKKFQDYRKTCGVHTSQQTLRVLTDNWNTFFKADTDYNKNLNKYKDKPKIPGYKRKNGYITCILTNQQVKRDSNNILHFPKTFNGFTIHTLQNQIQEVRILPRKLHIVVEVVYYVNIETKKADNGKYIGIDIGVNNLVAVANNIGLNPFLINGKGLKSINQFYNKRIANLRSKAKKSNGKYNTKKIIFITNKRNRRIEDILHKASKFILDYCITYDINTIIIGYNKRWKNNVKIGKRNNQNFVSIPLRKFIDMLTYKAHTKGINIIEVNEKYTSGTSYLDNEMPTKENYNKKRRIKRGMFLSNNKKYINADVNAAYQMIKKIVDTNTVSTNALYPVMYNLVKYNTKNKKVSFS